ncbi:MAG: hypothetical protein ACYCTG_04960 [Ferrimicrobium sp.]
MSTISQHFNTHSPLVAWLEASINVSVVVDKMELRNTTTLQPTGDATGYPWARVGTALSLALALHFNREIPSSCVHGANLGGGHKALEQAREALSRGQLTDAAIALEPYETLYRSGSIPVALERQRQGQVKADLDRLLEVNVPLLAQVQGDKIAEEDRFCFELPSDTVVADPDLVFRGDDDSITIVETKTTIRPQLTRFLRDAVEQLLFLAIFSADPKAKTHFDLVLHLARQGVVAPVPVASSTIYALRASLEQITA